MPLCCGGAAEGKGSSPTSRKNGAGSASKTRWSTNEGRMETYVEVDDTCDVVNLAHQKEQQAAQSDPNSPRPRNMMHTWSHDIVNNRSRKLLHKEEGPAELAPPTRDRSRKIVQESFWKEKGERRPSKLCSDRFCGPKDEYGDLARSVVSRLMELVDIVDAEEKDVSDHSWLGPAGSSHEHIIDWLLDMSTLQFTGFETPLDAVVGLSEAAKRILADQDTLVRVRAPVKIFGDIHGQLRDLLLFFNEFGRPTVGRNGDIEMVSYMFNGDWVDRGEHQLEVVVALFALKVTYPERIWLIRGNHEDAAQNRKQDSGFDSACEACFGSDGERAFNAVHSAFEYLPLAATVEDRVMVVHGGIGDGQWCYHDLKKIKRPLNHDALVKNPLIYNILWSDPVAENWLGKDAASEKKTFGVHNSPRGHQGMLKRFGSDITVAFCENNELGLLVRSHQCSSQGYGYTLMHKGYLMRVFSARHYDNKKENAAAMLLVGFKNLRAVGTKKRGLVVRAKVIRPPPLTRRSKSSRRLKKVKEKEESDDGLSEDDGPKRQHSSMSIDSECPEEEMAVAVATKDQKQVARRDWGVEVDEDCDVVNKSEGTGHKFVAQSWHNDEESSAQKLATDAVVGRPALCGDRFKGPRDNIGQLAGALVERLMELAEIVDREPIDVLDQQWFGPPEAQGNILQWMLSSEAIKRITKGDHPWKSMKELCRTAKDIMLKQQPTAMVELRAPVKVFGDLRGHLRDILLFFDEFGRPTVGRGGDIEVSTYVFNGGYVDSSAHQVELILALFALKVTYPERVWLVRGGHEAELWEKSPYKASFQKSLEELFGNAALAKELADEAFEVFDYLPLAVRIERSVLVVHGGIGDGHWNLSKLGDTSLPLKPEDLYADKVLYNIIWSHPLPDDGSGEKSEVSDPQRSNTDLQFWTRGSVDSRATNESNHSKGHEQDTKFGAVQTESFCHINGLGLIVRSHQCVQQGFGYSLLHNGKVLRVFSARNYFGQFNNAAAMLLIGYKRLLTKDDRGLVVRAKVLSPPAVLDDQAAVSAASSMSLISRSKRSSKAYKPISMDAEDTDASPLVGNRSRSSRVSCFSCLPCGLPRRSSRKPP